jgi:hypothetical protein
MPQKTKGGLLPTHQPKFPEYHPNFKRLSTNEKQQQKLDLNALPLRATRNSQKKKTQEVIQSSEIFSRFDSISLDLYSIIKKRVILLFTQLCILLGL